MKSYSTCTILDAHAIVSLRLKSIQIIPFVNISINVELYLVISFHRVICLAMNTKNAAAALAELGNETRLLIFRYLVKMGNQQVSVGDIQEEIKIPASTLSHHLSRLSRVGLIEQERSGRTLYCQPQLELLNGLIDFLVEECCEGQSCETPSKSCC